MKNKYTNLNFAKDFLSYVGHPISCEVEVVNKNTKKGKNDTPNHFIVKALYEKVCVDAELYFTDYELNIDFKEGELNYKSLWQTFVTSRLKGITQKKYVEFLEEKMVELLRETDKYFLDKISENPELEEDYCDRHDFVIKEILFEHKYLKELEYKLGLLKTNSFNPFNHPYFNKKEKAPRLVDIVEACNKREREEKEQAVQLEQQKESN